MRTKHADLKAFIDATGTSQAKLARQVGISQSYLSRIVNRRDTPLLELAIRIHMATGVPYESLVVAKASGKES